jgi:hypothetical protein
MSYARIKATAEATRYIEQREASAVALMRA